MHYPLSALQLPQEISLETSDYALTLIRLDPFGHDGLGYIALNIVGFRNLGARRCGGRDEILKRW